MKLREMDLFCGTGGFSYEARGDPDSFERLHFITAVTNGYVRFDYHGWHQELFRRLTCSECKTYRGFAEADHPVWSVGTLWKSSEPPGH